MRFSLLLCLAISLLLSVHGQNADAPADSSISLEFAGLSDEESQRHKRALGILLQGFMEALGYQVSPIQIATLPTSSSAMNPVAAAAAPPMMQLMPNGSSTPRQRETLRFTGVFNFGNNINATNLVDHLAQYERIFHGNSSSSTTPASAKKGNKKGKKTKKPPLPDPLFVKIPLPIAPDLPAPQAMPDDHEFYDNSHEQHLDEFHESQEDSGKHGHYQEEHDDSRHSEEYQNNHDEHYQDYEPYNRRYPGKKDKEEEEEEDYNKNNNNSSGPKEKLTEYKNNRNVENYRVENKELHHPDEVAEEAPLPSSKSLVGLDGDGPSPDWRENDEKRALEVAAEQEALAEALAEKNAARELEAKNRERERYEDEGRDKVSCDENCEESSYGNNEDDQEYVEEAAYDSANKENQRSYQARPAATANSNEAAKLRDSYGKSLQDAEGGPIDERLSGYFSMFKDPDSGLYDAERIKEYESARLPFYDYSEFLDGFNKIQKQMNGGGNKYEEYEIDKSPLFIGAEHREQDNRDAASRSSNKCKCDNNNNNNDNYYYKSAENSKEQGDPTTRSFGPTPKALALPGLPTQTTTFSPYFFSSYDPYETKEEIIARLTSYEPITRPATTAALFDDDAAAAGAAVGLSPAPPIGFAAERLLHDAAEIKEIESWPEARPTAAATLNLFRPATRRKQPKQQNVEILDENNSRPWVPIVPLDAKRRSGSNEQQRSQSKLSAKTTLNSLESTTATTTTTTTSTTTRKPTNHRSSYAQVQPRKSAVKDEGTTKRPTLLGASLRDFLSSTRHYKPRSPRPTKTMKKKKKYDFYTTKPASTTKFTASDARPTAVAAQPTPYYYNEKIGPRFADNNGNSEPKTNAERANVKVYKDRESVKVTEQDLRSRPEGTTQRIFKYTRRL